MVLGIVWVVFYSFWYVGIDFDIDFGYSQSCEYLGNRLRYVGD